MGDPLRAWTKNARLDCPIDSAQVTPPQARRNSQIDAHRGRLLRGVPCYSIKKCSQHEQWDATPHVKQEWATVQTYSSDDDKTSNINMQGFIHEFARTLTRVYDTLKLQETVTVIHSMELTAVNGTVMPSI